MSDNTRPKELGCRAFPDKDRDEEWCGYAQHEKMCGPRGRGVRKEHRKCAYWDGRIKSKYQEEKDGK